VTTNFGLDLSSLDDLDVWRLKTPHAMGVLAADAPDYGLDLLEAIGSAEVDGTIESLPDRVSAALTDDERISSAVVTITRKVEGPAVDYDIRIECETAEGPFTLVGAANSEVLDLVVVLLPGGN
jgi:hypothetical protein